MRRNRDFIGPAGMGGMVSLWGASSLIKSIQYISVSSTTASEAVTITAVNVANTLVIGLGVNTASASNFPFASQATAVLTNATTVTLAVVNTDSVTSIRTAVVIEFAPGVVKSIQSGTATINTNTASATATITAVNTSKTWITTTQNTNADTLSAASGSSQSSTLTNATTITFTRSGSPAAYYIVCSFFAVEFF